MYVLTEIGARFGLEQKDAEVIGTELGRMVQDGPVPATEIVEAARPAQATLHAYFEWDDAIAAEAYRCEQARELVRAVAIVVEGDKPPVRAFHFVVDPDTKNRGYVSLAQARSDQRLWEQVLADAQQALKQWEHRLAQYEELEPFAARIHEIVEEMRQPIAVPA